MAWEVGPFTLAPGASERRWFAFGPGDAGLQVIAPHPISPSAELDYSMNGIQLNDDCSLTYWITTRNIATVAVQFFYRGNNI